MSYLYTVDDIANVIEALELAAANVSLAGTPRPEYCQGYHDALSSVAMAFGLDDGEPARWPVPVAAAERKNR